MNRIRELRKKFNITQEKLAHDINVKQNTISNYENGSSEPDLETIKKLAKYFNVTIDYLLNTTNSDIILITRKDLNNLKEATRLINSVTNKLENNTQNYNITVGDGNTITNSFNRNED